MIYILGVLLAIAFVLRQILLVKNTTIAKTLENPPVVLFYFLIIISGWAGVAILITMNYMNKAEK